jgi:hypothetical protein
VHEECVPDNEERSPLLRLGFRAWGSGWRLYGLGYRVGSGEWRVESGEWRVESGGLRIEDSGRGALNQDILGPIHDACLSAHLCKDVAGNDPSTAQGQIACTRPVRHASPQVCLASLVALHAL